MIKCKRIKVFNFEGAIYGMRNPMNSWSKSDSDYCLNIDTIDCNNCRLHYNKSCNYMDDTFYIGPKDLKLAQSLVKAGRDERKFLRQIFITMNITAPLFW